MCVPLQCALELLEKTVADGYTVDQSVIGWLFSKTLLVVIHGCINLALFGTLQAFLLPKVGTIHVLDMPVEPERLPDELWHSQQ